MTSIHPDSPISVRIGNLGMYNEGALISEWVAIPCEDFEPIYERIGIGGRYEETFCTEWECDIPGLEFSRYPDYEKLNAIAEEWLDLDEYERAIVSARMELLSQDFDDAVRCKSGGRIWYGCSNTTDVAYAYVQECGILDNIDESIAMYFDYEAFGRDIGIEGNFTESKQGDLVEVW